MLLVFEIVMGRSLSTQCGMPAFSASLLRERTNQSDSTLCHTLSSEFVGRRLNPLSPFREIKSCKPGFCECQQKVRDSVGGTSGLERLAIPKNRWCFVRWDAIRMRERCAAGDHSAGDGVSFPPSANFFVNGRHVTVPCPNGGIRQVHAIMSVILSITSTAMLNKSTMMLNTTIVMLSMLTSTQKRKLT
jgi:hypothetical protein